MVEIRLAGMVRVVRPDLTRNPGSVRPVLPSSGYTRFDGISIPFCFLLFFITLYYVQIKLYLIQLIVSVDYTTES